MPSILLLFWSVRVNSFSHFYRTDIFGMRDLWGLTINSGRGAILKYLQDGCERQKTKKMAAFLGEKRLSQLLYYLERHDSS